MGQSESVDVPQQNGNWKTVRCDGTVVNGNFNTVCCIFTSITII